MRRSLLACFVLGLAALLLAGGCGARSELGAGAPADSQPGCVAKGACPLRLAFIGDPGAHPESMLQAFLAQSATVTRLHATGDPVSPLDATALAELDVVVLDELTRVYSPTEASALFAWVSAGGGVLSLTGYRGNGVDAQRPNSLLAPLGLQYTDPATDCVLLPIPGTGSPVTEGISQLEFCNGYHVSDAGQTGGTDVTLASSTGAPVLISQQRALGRALVWGDEWISFDDQFDAMDQLFWEQAVAWLGGS